MFVDDRDHDMSGDSRHIGCGAILDMVGFGVHLERATRMELKLTTTFTVGFLPLLWT